MTDKRGNSKSMNDKLSDKELIDKIIKVKDQDKEGVIQYFFFEKCAHIINYAINRVFDRQVEKGELINELYLYLQDNDWYKLRQFDYRSKLTTWLSVIAIRFFQKKRAELIENESSETLLTETGESFEQQIHQKIDVEVLLERLPNERYRFVVQKLFLEDKEPQEVANEMGITIDNLYNIKRRALQQLARIARKEVGYVGKYIR